jgi:hypothetical protein
MRIRTLRWSGALALVLVAGCARREAPAPAGSVPAVDSAAVTQARQVANELGGDLIGLLVAALDRGGPAAAISFCADSAQARTALHQAEGVYVRRVGTRVRNAANAPDSLEREILARFAAVMAAGGQPVDTAFVVPRAGGGYELQYARPLFVMERCLACHGAPAALAPEVKTLIAERYPQDAAVGYRAGDLRGAISVRLATR